MFIAFDIKEATRSAGGNKDICLEKEEKCQLEGKLAFN